MFDFIPNTYFLFAFGLILLIKGGDWFVDAATSIAHRFGLPELLIGATVVSIGTTLPEVMTSAMAALGGSGEIAYGNAIGSIICNTALISALTIAIMPGKADKHSLVFPVCFYFGVASFYAVNAYVFGRFDLWAGLVLIAAFVVYMVINVINMKKNPAEAELSVDEIEAAEIGDNSSSSRADLLKDILVLIGGALVIALGAHLLVNSATEIAESFGIPESVIALTVVALGTSLPELVTAITSLLKGHGALSLGNIIGANIFNLVLVSGVAITINPFTVPMTSSLFGQNTSLVLDVPVMFAVMALLTIPTLLRGKLARWQGISLLAIYAAFLVMQFVFVTPV
ncbi:MAG: calcium/sodium antiporter [Clostridia bacterium]|nr:calcium/sodium antiporter [Clostridia bacterium]